MSIIPGMGASIGFMTGEKRLPRPVGTSLLLHFDGANGGATFADETGKAVSAYGDAKLTTTNPKFGSACATFDGAGDYFAVPLTTDLQFRTGDFTLAFWFKTASTDSMYLASNQGVVSDSNGNYAMRINSGNLVYYEGSNIRYSETISGFGNGNWHHLAITRSGSSLRIFYDGAQIGTTYTTSYDYVTGGSYGFYFGQMSGGAQPFNGQLDELIVVKGAALWTSNFTPPMEPYA